MNHKNYAQEIVRAQLPPARFATGRSPHRTTQGLKRLQSTYLASLVSGPASPDLGVAAPFSLLGFIITANTGITTTNGSVGAPTENGSGTLTISSPGVDHANDATALAAKVAMATARTDIAGRTATATIATALGSTTLTPGVYTAASNTFTLTGTLTLDAQGDPNAIFIFHATTSMTFAASARISLINGAQAGNVYWTTATATLGATSILMGTFMATGNITVGSMTSIAGRLFADADNSGAGTLTMDTDEIINQNIVLIHYSLSTGKDVRADQLGVPQALSQLLEQTG